MFNNSFSLWTNDYFVIESMHEFYFVNNVVYKALLVVSLFFLWGGGGGGGGLWIALQWVVKKCEDTILYYKFWEDTSEKLWYTST